MSNEDAILTELKNLNVTVAHLDEAIRGPQDASRPGLAQKQADQESRIKRLEAGVLGTGGIGAVLATAYAWFSRGG